MERIGIGLLGLGTVGTGVVRLLTEEGNRMTRRAGRALTIERVLVRDLSKKRNVEVSPARLTTNFDDILHDPSIDIIAEAAGGVEPAKTWILRALASGKHVVTANKALLAEHGAELFEAARRHRRALAFEASVGGGIPIIQSLSVALAANQIKSLAAILNGTCNFILTSMSDAGLPYEVALRQAQGLGYAEADPTMDVDGTDTAHKLSILAQVAFDADAKIERIPRQGIDRLALADLRYAAELGYAIKLLALANLVGDELAVRVAPTLVKHGAPLADARGPYNAIRVVGDAVGDTLFYGRGAGSLPTASAMVGDIIDVATGRAVISSSMLSPWGAKDSSRPLAPPERVRSRNYFRFTIADRPGVLASIAKALGDEGISIASVIQHDPGEDEGADPAVPAVPLVVMTHSAPESSVAAALATIDRMGVVKAPSVRLGVLD